jgi:hypothetical protein
MVFIIKVIDKIIINMNKDILNNFIFIVSLTNIQLDGLIGAVLLKGVVSATLTIITILNYYLIITYLSLIGKF